MSRCRERGRPRRHRRGRRRPGGSRVLHRRPVPGPCPPSPRDCSGALRLVESLRGERWRTGALDGPGARAYRPGPEPGRRVRSLSYRLTHRNRAFLEVSALPDEPRGNFRPRTAVSSPREQGMSQMNVGPPSGRPQAGQPGQMTAVMRAMAQASGPKVLRIGLVAGRAGHRRAHHQAAHQRDDRPEREGDRSSFRRRTSRRSSSSSS